MLDLIIRSACLVMPDGLETADIGIADGFIVRLQDEISEPAKAELDASGCHVFPGLLDMHVHFNEPGRAAWEGIRTGSRALVAAGGTLFADMPLNSDPPLLTVQAFEDKLAVAKQKSQSDFALWAGLTPDNLGQLGDLAALGVVGFKAFMSHSGIAEFRAADDATLYQGMELAAKLGLPVAVHAENDSLTQAGAQALRSKPLVTAQDYHDSRPLIAELEAISRAILFAEETACDLHIVHVSSARGIALIRKAQAGGVRVSSETCPHYLTFSTKDMDSLAAVAKCAPPLRAEAERLALLECVKTAEVDIIASDHSPCEPALKDARLDVAWGGINGVQVTLASLLSLDVPLAHIAALSATTPAARFSLPHKGRLAVGYHADLAIVDLSQSYVLAAENLHTRHPVSPYLGRNLKGLVRYTLLRGQVAYQKGRFLPIQGRFIKPYLKN